MESNMNRYTDTISVALAEKLKDKGMPLGSYVYMPNGMVSRKDEANLAYFDDQLIPYCTYADVFDWLMSEKRQYIWIEPHFRVSGDRFSFRINFSSDERIFDTWHETATKAIEKALTLI